MALLSKQGIAGFMLATVTGVSYARDAINLQQPVTQIAEQIYDMHTLMLIICLVIFVAVFGVMFYSVFAHRKSKGAVAAQFHESTTVEILWTIIPIFILLGMALARDEDRHRDEGHIQSRHHGEGDWLSVEMGLRLH